MNFAQILQDLRVYRMGPFSVPDTVGSYIIMCICAPLLVWISGKVGIKTTVMEWLALVLPLALSAHIIFGADTPFTQMFLGEGFLIAKIVLVAMVVFGLKGFAQALRKFVFSV